MFYCTIHISKQALHSIYWPPMYINTFTTIYVFWVGFQILGGLNTIYTCMHHVTGYIVIHILQSPSIILHDKIRQQLLHPTFQNVVTIYKDTRDSTAHNKYRPNYHTIFYGILYCNVDQRADIDFEHEGTQNIFMNFKVHTSCLQNLNNNFYLTVIYFSNLISVTVLIQIFGSE